VNDEDMVSDEDSGSAASGEDIVSSMPPARSIRRLLFIIAVPAAPIVGLVFGWRYVFAPLLAAALLSWSIASLRVLVQDAQDDDGVPAVQDGPERTVFRCAECGMEVLLLYRATPKAPSHCGQRMVARTEIVR
jgi:DNA-directed RNA polymerase subunit RPC12/RpoP